ncbi:MAG: hypothetical protein HUJ63_05675 [Enterococcus sp.]|nr:hypothetical protein [Enterococcus sp.]
MGKIRSFVIGGILGVAAGAYFLSKTGQKTVKKLSGNVIKAATDAVDNVKKNSKVTDTASKIVGVVSDTFKSKKKEGPVKEAVFYVASNVASQAASASEKVAEVVASSPKKKQIDNRTFAEKTDITAGKTDAERRNAKIVIEDRAVVDKINKKRVDVVNLIVESAKNHK